MLIKRALLIIAAVVMGMGCIKICAQDEIRVEIDGKEILFEEAPYIKNGRTMVPVRKIFESLGCGVFWDDDLKRAEAYKDSRRQSVFIGAGDDFMYVNGERVGLEQAAETVNDRMFVPLRAVSEAFLCDVEWIDEERLVRIIRLYNVGGVYYERKPYGMTAHALADKTRKEIVIQEEIKGEKVVKIDDWFKYNGEGVENLESVTLPESVKEIGTYAFSGARNLNTINLENVETIDQGAFEETALQKIDVKNVKVLGAGAFSGCKKLKEVELLNTEKWSGLLCYATNEGSDLVPYRNAVWSSPFSWCEGLEKAVIRFPENPPEEANPALFVGCPNLKEVIFLNYTYTPARYEFCNIRDVWDDVYVKDPSKAPSYTERRIVSTHVEGIPEGLVIKSGDVRVEEYARSIGADFVFLDN